MESTSSKKDDAASRFRFINSINYGKNSLVNDPDLEKDYSPFFINRSLSYHKDTFFLAFEMDRLSHIPRRYQYLYLLNGVKKGKRFSKFVRRVSDGAFEKETVDLISDYFSLSPKKAREVANILSKDDIQMIKQKQYKGGIKYTNGRTG